MRYKSPLLHENHAAYLLKQGHRQWNEDAEWARRYPESQDAHYSGPASIPASYHPEPSEQFPAAGPEPLLGLPNEYGLPLEDMYFTALHETSVPLFHENSSFIPSGDQDFFVQNNDVLSDEALPESEMYMEPSYVHSNEENYNNIEPLLDDVFLQKRSELFYSPTQEMFYDPFGSIDDLLGGF